MSDESLARWAERQLAPARPTGPAEQVKRVAWSTVLRLPVAGGAVYAKECRGLTGYEPGLVTALAGITVDRSGAASAFVVMADRIPPGTDTAAREARDQAAAALAACRCR